MKDKTREKDPLTPSANPYLEDPETVYDQINKYGTYEIQPTNATEHPFPKIAQGLPKPENRKQAQE